MFKCVYYLLYSVQLILILFINSDLFVVCREGMCKCKRDCYNMDMFQCALHMLKGFSPFHLTEL